MAIIGWGKDEWHIQHRLHSGTVVADFKPAGEITFDMNWNTPCSATYQIARSDPKLTRDGFAPYRTDCFIWKGQDLILSGPHTSRKWSSDNEGVIDVAMNDWMHLLEKLYYPMPVSGDELAIANRKAAWKSWPTNPNVDRNGEYLNRIISDICAIRNAVDPLQWSVEVMPSGGDISTRGFFTWAGLDSQTMYDCVKHLSELAMGFDFDVRFVSTNHVAIRLWHHPGLGTKSTGKPIFTFTRGDQFASISWEDIGPKATRTFGTAQGHGNVSVLADVSIYQPSDDTYRQLESVEAVGEIGDYYQFDRTGNALNMDNHIIRKLTGALGHRNRGPIHQINMSFNTSIFPFNWWTNVTPGDRLRVDYDFDFHRINVDFNILGYTGVVNAQGDELITPDLERILPYGTSSP